MSFLPHPSYIIPSASCGQLILLISGLLLCIFFFFCKNKQTDTCVFSYFSFFFTPRVIPYLYTFALPFFFPKSHCMSIHGDVPFLHVSICGRLSWPQIICCFSLKKLECISSPLELGMTLWIVLSNACRVSDVLELPNTDLQKTMCLFSYTWKASTIL